MNIHTSPAKAGTPNLRLVSLVLFLAVAAAPAAVFNCYEPVPGGWHLWLKEGTTTRPDPQSRIGVVPSHANPRLFRRPLYPPADRGMIFSPAELSKLGRVGFRPLVLAYHEPRFLFDYHSAGGLLGHLYVGLVPENGASKWLHQWSDIDLNYVDGRLEYTLRDRAFPGVTVRLVASALARSAGLILRIEVEGAKSGTRLVWSYGGASAFFTNYAMTAPEFGFAPNQCAKDRVSCQGGTFMLRRSFDKGDVIMGEVFAAPKYVLGWTATIRGGSSWTARGGLAAPELFAATPGDLARRTDWQTQGERTGRVAVVEAPLDAVSRGFIVVGMGGDIEAAIQAPSTAWNEALSRNHDIANRVTIQTPDPYLNAAVTMMAFATEGLWGDLVMLHGGWSWRFGYLGWRHWYGPTCYGWTDRVKQCIREHVRKNRVTNGPDAGALGSLIEYSPGVFYNMNEVFLDHVRQYFDYTGDLELMREIFPVLKGILEWEDRRLRPGPEPLYENALNTWISDQHWYIRGQCTQASAYMLNANRFLADLAPRIGQDPTSFATRAKSIHEAMQRLLWQPRAGVYAEYLDTLGMRLLHTQPELPTLYHSAEFGGADPFQIYQMLRWADTHLGQVRTPGGGKQYWSSDWFPNMARSYTHSTFEMAYGEELNFALTHYLAGQAEDAYALLRASLCGVFNGPTPGGLSCHAYIDGCQRANDEFADAISMWGRTIMEGLFGIAPKRASQRIDLTPQFPSDWTEASIRAPQFSYQWKKTPALVQIDWSSPATNVVRLRLPVCAARIDKVLVDGQSAQFRMEPGFGVTWLNLETPAADHGTIAVAYQAEPGASTKEVSVRQGESLSLHIDGHRVTDWRDPQGVLAGTSLGDSKFRRVTGNTALAGREGGVRSAVPAAGSNAVVTITGDPGPAVVFLTDTNAACPRWHPLHLRIEPQFAQALKRWVHPSIPDKDLARWELVDLSGKFNSAVNETLDRVHAAVKAPALPASEINTIYYKDHLVPPFVSSKPSDARWRKIINSDGIGWTTETIPFKSPKSGPNIAVVTRAANVFPPTIDVEVNASGRALYLMLSGTTFAMQSQVVNVRVTLAYADGAQEAHDLVNPFSIGDCWNQYRYHDTAANGFENLGGRLGPDGSAQVADLNRPIAVDTEAHLLQFDLKPGRTLRSVRLEAVANDVVFGLMGASVLK